jgi:hypothetical protein
MWGTLSDKKSGLYFPVFAGDCQRSLSQMSPTGFMSIVYFLSIFETPQPGGPGSCIYFPQEQGSQVIPLGIGFGSLYHTHENKYLLTPGLTNFTKKKNLRKGQK